MSGPVDLRQYRHARVSDPRAVLERLLAPEVLQALDAYVRELAKEAAGRRADVVPFADKPWLTVAEAAQALGCSERAVRARARAGRLHGRFQGRRLYIEAQSILDLGAYPARTTNTVAPAAQERPGAGTRKD